MAMYNYVYEKDFREFSDWVKKSIPYSVMYGKFDVEKNLKDVLKKEGPFEDDITFEEDTTLWCKNGEDMYVPSMYTFLTSLAYVYSCVSKNFSSVGHKHSMSDINMLVNVLETLGRFSIDGTEYTVDHRHSLNDIDTLVGILTQCETAIGALGRFNTDNTQYIVNHTHTKSNITDFAHTHPKSDITGLESEINDIKNKLSYIEGQHIKINNYQRYAEKNGTIYKYSLQFYYRARDGKYHSDNYGEGAVTLDVLMPSTTEPATMTARAQWATCVTTNQAEISNDPHVKLYAAVNKRTNATNSPMTFYDIPSKYGFGTRTTAHQVSGTSKIMYNRALLYYYNVSYSTANNNSQDIYVTDLNPLSVAKDLELAYDLVENVYQAATASAMTAPLSVMSSNFVEDSLEDVGKEKIVATFTGDSDLSQYIQN